MIEEQLKVKKELTKLINIFQTSDGEIRPHFVLTGPSGSGKSHTIALLAEEFDLGFVEINAAQLTKEGIAGNSLSKAMVPLREKQQQLTICFVDEFDKLFISGNSNSGASESTAGIQNEFLKVLEGDVASVADDYGKFTPVKVSNVLFIFAGAFNGEPEMTIDKLRDFGIKTEFLGRVGLVFNCVKPSLQSLIAILEESKLLNNYLSLFTDVDAEEPISAITKVLEDTYQNNTLGVRAIQTLIHQYFIKGGLEEAEVKEVTFSKKLTFK
jgi:ATP-dependent protease Clp ATPase subunit